MSLLDLQVFQNFKNLSKNLFFFFSFKKQKNDIHTSKIFFYIKVVFYKADFYVNKNYLKKQLYESHL